MPRSPARITQADIARAVRAVKQCGDDMRVRILPDGSIIIEREALHPMPDKAIEATPLERM